MVLVKKRPARNIVGISGLRHKNLASLYGSTKPDSMGNMFLVYEYVPNSSVGHHLHGPYPDLLIQNEEQIALNWALRFRIAIETAEVISYFHSLESPVIFGKLTTYNILLDENFHVKLTGLMSYTRSPIALGYGSSILSLALIDAKSDVYSFGVVLLELVSGSQPKSTYGLHGWGLPDMYLSTRAPKMIRRNKLDQLVDGKLDYHSNLDTKGMVKSVAKLACRCVRPDGKMRPNMSEVLSDLKKIKDGSN